jgi:glycosyltransferase EpsE
LVGRVNLVLRENVMEKKPLISVLMGVYYQRPDVALLVRSVNSILQQSVADFELLICDDGSNEIACAFLDETVRRDKRVKLVRPRNAFALAVKLNHCLTEARGQWIARMDDDDYSYPERFAKQLNYLQQHQEIAFVGCNVNLVCDGAVVGQRNFAEWPQVRDFYFKQPFIHPGLLFRREALEEVGGYSEAKRQLLCEDYDLLLRLYKAGYKGANLQETLLDYTVPATAKGSRKMKHRWNEAVTRYGRFKELGVLPGALPYVVKPLAVGLLPEFILRKMKKNL